MLVGRLDLEKYKATIKGLTQFGDRRQGTDRNRAAVDWIEAQLKSYGCTNTERIKYELPAAPAAARRRRRARRRRGGGRGGGRGAGAAAAAAVSAAAGAAVPGRAAARSSATAAAPASTTIPTRSPTQASRAQLAADDARPREEVYCTKIGTTRPDEMYIVGAHMDGHGWGEAANDDGSGTALVMELARIFSSPDVQTERSIRFALWNNEETGLNGARGLRRPAQGPPGQGRPAGIGQVSRSRSGSA